MTADDEIARLHRRIDGIDAKLDTLIVSSATRDGTFDRCMMMLDSHERIIRGNGQKGLQTRLDIMETQISKIPGTGDGRIGVRGIVLIIGAVGTAIGGAITAVLSGLFGG